MSADTVDRSVVFKDHSDRQLRTRAPPEKCALVPLTTSTHQIETHDAGNNVTVPRKDLLAETARPASAMSRVAQLGATRFGLGKR